MKPSATTMDWMHNFLVNGVGNLEFHLFLSRARSELGIHFAQVQAFMTADWQFPRWQATHKARCGHLFWRRGVLRAAQTIPGWTP